MKPHDTRRHDPREHDEQQRATNYDTAQHAAEFIRRSTWSNRDPRRLSHHFPCDNQTQDDDEISDGSMYENTKKHPIWPVAESSGGRSLKPNRAGGGPMALRIQPLVETHRSSSGRNVRLKHITHTQHETLSPHALTPRVPTGRRPSSVRSGESRKGTSVRSSSYPSCFGGMPSGSTLSTASDTLHRKSKQQSSKEVEKTPKTNQERRSSFRISADILRELEKARTEYHQKSTYDRSIIPEEDVDEDDEEEDSDDGHDHKVEHFEQECGHEEESTYVEQQQKEEEEQKVVYRFDLWKKALKHKPLPNAITTQQQPHMQQQSQSQHFYNQQQTAVHPPQYKRPGASPPRPLKSIRPECNEKQSIQDACAMVSKLHMDNSTRKGNIFGSDDAPVSLSLTRSRSPKIGGNRASRRLQEMATPPENNTITKWKQGELIGEGTFGKVYMGLNLATGELFALKEIEISASPNADQMKQMQKLGEEIAMMNNLSHKHIVRYKGSHRTDKFFYIFMEYVPGGSIASMLKQFDAFSEGLIRIFTRQIVEGVMYLHSMGIIHRDIKGANVLVNEQGVSKLADFGCSKQLPQLLTTSLEESLRSIRGSIPWMAPEVVKQTGHGYPADIWSIGATVIEMATASHPWPASTNSVSAMYAIATATSSPPIPEHLSLEAKSFLQRCFCINPEERATAEELTRHVFLANT